VLVVGKEGQPTSVSRGPRLLKVNKLPLATRADSDR
jgi:hypothetical protein